MNLDDSLCQNHQLVFFDKFYVQKGAHIEGQFGELFNIFMNLKIQRLTLSCDGVNKLWSEV